MNKYTPIHTHAQLVEALRRGLTVEINSKDNESAADYQAQPPSGWVAGLPSVTTAADDPNSYAWWGFAFRAVGEHDLSPAQPEPKPLTNADLNPGDIVRFRGKEWRVQGIDDNDPNVGLLLLDVAEPKVSPDFVDDAHPATRGSGRRPGNGTGGHRWCWAGAGEVELVSRGEPEARPAEPETSDFGAINVPAYFHISVTIHADTPEGYAAAIETLARGIES